MVNLTGQGRAEDSEVSEVSKTTGASSETSDEARLSFAREVFANVQDLTRTMAQKANNLQASVALLTAPLGILASNAITADTNDDLQRLFKGAGVILIVVYLLMAFDVIYVAAKVYQARTQSVRPDTTAPGMLFPLMLLERYSVGGKADEF